MYEEKNSWVGIYGLLFLIVWVVLAYCKYYFSLDFLNSTIDQQTFLSDVNLQTFIKIFYKENLSRGNLFTLIWMFFLIHFVIGNVTYDKLYQLNTWVLKPKPESFIQNFTRNGLIFTVVNLLFIFLSIISILLMIRFG